MTEEMIAMTDETREKFELMLEHHDADALRRLLRRLEANGSEKALALAQVCKAKLGSSG